MPRPWLLRLLALVFVLTLVILALAESLEIRNRLARGEALQSPRTTDERIRRSHP